MSPGRGRRWLLVLLAVALAAAVVALLFAVVFPWFDRMFVNDPVLGLVVADGPVRAWAPGVAPGP